MANLVKKIPHPTRTGFHITFDNGHMYSVVNLGAPFLPRIFETDDKEIQAIMDKVSIEAAEQIGKMYDGLGGRYEAIQLPETTEDGNWGEPIRGRSFGDVIMLVGVIERDEQVIEQLKRDSGT